MELDKKPWTGTVVKTLTTNPWFSVLLQSVKGSEGADKTYYTLDFPTPAVGIVMCRGDEILLIRQYRFIIDQYVWAIPSGGVSEGEKLEDAAVREMLEETGYECASLRPILSFYPSYGCSNQRFEIFRADNPADSGEMFDASEVLSLKWFSRQEVLDLIMQNGIVDGLSLAPLLLVLLEEISGGELRKAETVSGK